MLEEQEEREGSMCFGKPSDEHREYTSFSELIGDKEQETPSLTDLMNGMWGIENEEDLDFIIEKL